MKKALIALLAVLALGSGGYLLYQQISRPLPGEAVADQGREHTTDIFGITYNSNPPTSGTHFPVWAKKGVYDRVLSDGYLIHSLEHGYVVISYDCSKLTSSSFRLAPAVLAHEEEIVSNATDSGTPLMHMKVGLGGEMAALTPETAPPVEVELPESFKTDECKSLVDDLDNFLEDFERVIVVPRLSMEKLVSLTAWRRILKLDSFNEAKMREFIQAFHNRGPEQTIE